MHLKALTGRSRVAIVVGAAFVLVVAVLFSDSLVTGQVSTEGLSSITEGVTTTIVNAISGTGYAGVFGLMFLESTSLPVPSEVILPFAGYLVSTGRLEFWLTVILAVAAGISGGLVDYYIGRFLGMKVISDYGGRFFIGEEQFQRIDRLFARHGSIIVLVSRLIPGIRTLSSFPAGAARMNVAKFIAFTAIGCFFFDTALVYAGDYLGSNWNAIRAIGVLEVGATLAVIAIGAWIFLRMHRSSSQRAPSEVKSA